MIEQSYPARKPFYSASKPYTIKPAEVSSGDILMVGHETQNLSAYFKGINIPFLPNMSTSAIQGKKIKSLVIVVDLKQNLETIKTTVKETIKRFCADTGLKNTPIIVAAHRTNLSDQDEERKIRMLQHYCDFFSGKTAMKSYDQSEHGITNQGTITIVETASINGSVNNKDIVAALANNPNTQIQVSEPNISDILDDHIESMASAIPQINQRREFKALLTKYIEKRSTQRDKSGSEFYFPRRLFWSWGSKTNDRDKLFSADRKIAAANIVLNILDNPTNNDIKAEKEKYKAELTQGELGRLAVKAGITFKK